MPQVGPLEAVELPECELGLRRDVVVGFGLGRRAVAVVARPEVGRRTRGLEVAAPADAQPFGNNLSWIECRIVKPLFEVLYNCILKPTG